MGTAKKVEFPRDPSNLIITFQVPALDPFDGLRTTSVPSLEAGRKVKKDHAASLTTYTLRLPIFFGFRYVEIV
jgi:hypothetical protein